MKTIIKYLFTLSVSLLLTPFSFAQWSILSTTSVKLESQTSDVSKDFWLNITIKNNSKISQYIWGQSFGENSKFYMIEALIKNSESQVWERQNVTTCGSLGVTSWQEVKPGQEIKIHRRESLKDIGKEMILAFQTSSSSESIPSKRLEVLLGLFKIPIISEKKTGKPKQTP